MLIDTSVQFRGLRKRWNQLYAHRHTHTHTHTHTTNKWLSRIISAASECRSHPQVCVPSPNTTVIPMNCIACIPIGPFKFLSRALLRTRKLNFGFLKMRTPAPSDQRNNKKYPRINIACSHNTLLQYCRCVQTS
jgi:hypothetical protein